MFKLPTHETKTLVAVHGWSAVALGFLLYAVVLTGTVAVFAHEIGHWSIGKPQADPVFEQSVDAHVRKAVASVDERYRDEVGVMRSPHDRLLVWPHTHETRDGAAVEDIGVLIEIDPRTGEEVSRREGWARDVFRADPATALERFLIDAHVQLYVPEPWGLILTGILGLAMLAAAVSGLLMHRHLIRDIFTLRRERTTPVAARDEHTVAATWGLPFAFLVAFTGSFFSFAISFGLPMMAMVAFEGDRMKLFETLVGASAAEDTRPGAVADLDALLRDARARANGEVLNLSVAHYGRMDSKVTVQLEAPAGQLERTVLVYGAVSGAFEKTKPTLGTAPSVGATLFAIVAPLHFGNFAGVLSKAVWFALGFSSCFMIVTGLTLWLKRRADDPGWRPFAVANSVVTYGLPICLAASAYGFFLFYPAAGTMLAPPIAFLLCALALIAFAVLFRHKQRLDAVLMLGLGLALALLPVARMATGGPGWAAALGRGAGDTLAIDIALLIGGATCCVFGWRWLSDRAKLPHEAPAAASVRGEMP